MKQKLLGAALLLLATSAWGGTYVVTKFALASIPIFSLVFGRYLVAWVALTIICRVRRVESLEREEKKRVWPPALVGYVASIILQFWGTDLCGASTASLINVSSTLFVAVFAAMLLREKLTARKLISCLIGFAGVAFVIGFGAGTPSNLFGGVITIASAVTWALMTVLFKRIPSHISVLAVTRHAIQIALLVMLPLSVIEMLGQRRFFFSNPSVLLSVLYIGLIATALAYFAWNKGIALMDTSTGSLFINFQPMVTALLGWIFLHETLGWSFFAGAALLFVAILIAATRARPAANEEPGQEVQPELAPLAGQGGDSLSEAE